MLCAPAGVQHRSNSVAAQSVLCRFILFSEARVGSSIELLNRGPTIIRTQNISVAVARARPAHGANLAHAYSVTPATTAHIQTHDFGALAMRIELKKQ